MHLTTSTMFHRWCCMLWAVPSLPHTFSPLSFWYRLIFISAVQRMLFQKWSGFFRCFWQSVIWPCGEPSVFALVTSSLDCRHVYLLKSVLLLAGCCERERILRSSPLYLLWWSLLLIVDTSTSWRVFFSWLDVVKERGSSDHHLCICSGEVFSWL